MTTSPRAICFLDMETTSLHPDREAWEVAMVRREPDGWQDEIQFFIDVSLEHADPFSLAIGGFYDRHPMGHALSHRDRGTDDYTGSSAKALSRTSAAHAVAQWTHEAIIVGAVPNFDTEVLGTLLRDYGFLPTWHHHLQDVENLVVGWLSAELSMKGYGEDRAEMVAHALELPYISDELSMVMGVEPPTQAERHTAMGDTRWVMRMYDAVMA